MKKRSPLIVLVLPLVTFGLYSLYWAVKTKGEMNKLGANIPSALLILVPVVNIWWIWKHSEGVDHVTGGKMSAVLAFILVFLLGFIGQAIIQDSFNKIGEVAPTEPTAAEPPAAPTEPAAPAPTPPAA